MEVRRYTYILCCTTLQIKARNVLKGIVRAMDAYNYLVRTRMIRADLISLSFNATVTLKKYKSASFSPSLMQEITSGSARIQKICRDDSTTSEDSSFTIKLG